MMGAAFLFVQAREFLAPIALVLIVAQYTANPVAPDDKLFAGPAHCARPQRRFRKWIAQEVHGAAFSRPDFAGASSGMLQPTARVSRTGTGLPASKASSARRRSRRLAWTRCFPRSTTRSSMRPR